MLGLTLLQLKVIMPGGFKCARSFVWHVRQLLGKSLKFIDMLPVLIFFRCPCSTFKWIVWPGKQVYCLDAKCCWNYEVSGRGAEYVSACQHCWQALFLLKGRTVAGGTATVAGTFCQALFAKIFNKCLRKCGSKLHFVARLFLWNYLKCLAKCGSKLHFVARLFLWKYQKCLVKCGRKLHFVARPSA